jgi:pseudouridine-5'-phosphate glycosidase
MAVIAVETPAMVDPPQSTMPTILSTPTEANNPTTVRDQTSVENGSTVVMAVPRYLAEVYMTTSLEDSVATIIGQVTEEMVCGKGTHTPYFDQDVSSEVYSELWGQLQHFP